MVRKDHDLFHVWQKPEQMVSRDVRSLLLQRSCLEGAKGTLDQSQRPSCSSVNAASLHFTLAHSLDSAESNA